MKLRTWACALLLGAVAACGPHQAEPLSAFDGRIADWTRDLLADSPELATQAGASADDVGGPYADRLDDRSAIAVEARRTGALRRLAELRELDVSALDDDDRLTYDVLREQFEAAAGGANFSYGSFSPLGGVRPYVLNQLDSAFLTLPVFFDRRQQVTSFADADAYIARLHHVAAALDAETVRAQADARAGVTPPLVVVDDTLALLDAISAKAPLDQTYVRSLQRKLDAVVAAETDPARHAAAQSRELGLLAQAVQITRDEIVPAHQRAAAFLRSIRATASADAGVWRLPHGDDFYRAALRIETTTTFTPQQINRLGQDRVRELTNELDIALRRVGLTEGTAGQRLAQLTADPRYRYPPGDPGRQQLFADIQVRVNRVMSRAHDWFGTLPRAQLTVEPAPDFMSASSPGAFYSPPSIQPGSSGVYYINLRDLAQMTRIDVPTTDFHEAVPGHHFQVSLAREQTQIPLLRRLMTFDAYSEGWADYAEQFVDEQGFYDDDPVGRIGYLRWQLWRAARLVVDTGLHAGHWSRDQAIDYLKQTTGDNAATIASEVDRYIVWPGQACSYELGRREITRLREVARDELGASFDLKGFHDAVLLNGQLPLSVLDRVVARWIEDHRGRRS